MYILVWILIASYYSWSAQEETVTDPIDESGWVSDEALANQLQDISTAEVQDQVAE